MKRYKRGILSWKIPLPKVTKFNTAKAHSFPFQIGYQTLEFLQGTIFYVSFADIAAGAYVRIPGAMDNIEKYFLERLYNKESYDQAWEYLHKYQEIFEKTVFSNVLISFCSHWDWYIRRLSDFIKFARTYVNSPNLSKSEEDDLKRISNISFTNQIEILEKASGIIFEISREIRDQLKEMTLVRNLGLHNRWEVDEKYLLYSKTKCFEIGDLRLVKIDELNCWHGGLISLITETSKLIAIKYLDAPDYPLDNVCD